MNSDLDQGLPLQIHRIVNHSRLDCRRIGGCEQQDEPYEPGRCANIHVQFSHGDREFPRISYRRLKDVGIAMKYAMWICWILMAAPATLVASAPAASYPLGAHVLVFNARMPLEQIQARVDEIARQQISDQFGSGRYALLFEPGTYGSSAHPLKFQVGYYTQVAGLGAAPGDVVIRGAVQVRNQCSQGQCTFCLN
jgi:hypothetical protein